MNDESNPYEPPKTDGELDKPRRKQRSLLGPAVLAFMAYCVAGSFVMRLNLSYGFAFVLSSIAFVFTVVMAQMLMSRTQK